MWPGLETDSLGEYAQVLIDRQLYGDAAIFKAAYWFTDRFYVYLQSASDDRLILELRSKSLPQSHDLRAACAEFCNSLIDFRVRGIVLNETSAVRDALITKAFMEGVPKPRPEMTQAPSDAFHIRTDASTDGVV